MQLARVRLKNYRCHIDVEIPLTTRTLLVGGNAAGKTSVLEAVDKVFGAGRRNYGFREDDLAVGANRLTVELEIRPSNGDVFTPDEHILFETHVDFDEEANEFVLVRAEAGLEDDGMFRSRAAFYKADGGEDGALDAATRDQVSFFYLPAVRDAQRELDERSGLWARLAPLLGTAHDPALVTKLTTEAGRDLVTAILGENRLDELAVTVQSFVEAMYGGEDVRVEFRATALDFRALLRRIALVIGSEDRLRPVDQHSTGLQTLALFGLFRAYLATAGGHLLAAGLEEPEVHLSPHVARTLVELATESGTQVLFTTHSPVISDRLRLTDVVVLRLTSNGTVARSLPEAGRSAKSGDTRGRAETSVRAERCKGACRPAKSPLWR